MRCLQARTIFFFNFSETKQAFIYLQLFNSAYVLKAQVDSPVCSYNVLEFFEMMCFLRILILFDDCLTSSILRQLL